MSKKKYIRNHEGYHDPTASAALNKIMDEERRVTKLIHAIKDICYLSGYEVEGRIVLRNIRTGEVWK